MRHSVVRALPYAPDRLFDLVSDVEAYPEFIPWIQSLRTWNRHETPPYRSVFDAEVKVGFSFLKESFSTRVELDRGERRILVRLLKGPFDKLVNLWRFEPHEDGALILFDIDFEFRTPLLRAVLEANFDTAANRLISCFETRAAALYGGVT